MLTSRTFKQGLLILSLVAGSAFAVSCNRSSGDGAAADQAQSGSGDPSDGTTEPQPAPTPTVWTACATENGVCLFDGTADVRYGYDGVYVTVRATYQQVCSNAAFGSDPVPGIVKSCEYGNIVAAPPIDDTGWTFCANENEHCTFVGHADVRYGANHIYATQDVADGATGIDCNNTTFGDPLVGTLKHCEFRTK